MKTTLRALLTATFIASTLGLGSAHAAVLGTESDTVGFTPTELTGTLVIPAFGGSGVTSIDIEITGNLESVITLTNTGALNQNLSAESQSDFTFSSTDLSLPPAPQLSLSASTGTVSVASGATETFPVSDTGAFTFTTATGLASLLDGFTVDVTTLTSLGTTGGGGNVASTQNTQAQAILDVTYNGETTTVPTPATLMLLGMALLTLGVYGRRYRQL